MATGSGPDPHALTEEEAAAWVGFLDVHARVIGVMDRRLTGEQGISVRWYDVLATLFDAEGHRLRMSDLAARVVLSPSRVTRLVDRLESEGLLTRESAGEGGRTAWAVLTEAGRQRLRAAARTHHEVVRELFTGPMTATQRRQLAVIWERLLRSEA